MFWDISDVHILETSICGVACHQALIMADFKWFGRTLRGHTEFYDWRDFLGRGLAFVQRLHMPHLFEAFDNMHPARERHRRPGESGPSFSDSSMKCDMKCDRSMKCQPLRLKPSRQPQIASPKQWIPDSETKDQKQNLSFCVLSVSLQIVCTPNWCTVIPLQSFSPFIFTLRPRG